MQNFNESLTEVVSSILPTLLSVRVTLAQVHLIADPGVGVSQPLIGLLLHAKVGKSCPVCSK